MASKGPLAHVGFQDHHADARADGRDVEEEWQQLRVPEWVQLRGHDEVERAERGLVQGREQHARDHQRRDDAVDDSHWRVKAEAFKYHRSEFDGEDGGVKHHAPGDLEHDRMRIPVDDGVPDAPGLAQVEHEGRDHEDVAQESRQDRRPHDGFEFLEIEEMHHRRQRKGASGQAHAAKQVEADPEPPWELVTQMGDRAETLVKAQHCDDAKGDEDQSKNDGPKSRAEPFRGQCDRCIHEGLPVCESSLMSGPFCVG